MSSRRNFLQSSIAVGLVAGLAGTRGGLTASRRVRILILGGTGFLGPHIVSAALVRGHEMTLFNRGKTNPHLFPEVEKLRGDRDGNLEALKGRRWDAVIDTSGYVPRLVADSAGLLSDHCDQYVFISTLSVYESFAKPMMDERAPVGTLEDESTEEVTGETYGPLKALCEQAAEAAMPGRVTVIRPGLIVGPGDNTDRFTYWPVRVARGGEVLAPGTPTDPIQIIDVRDLAGWTIHCIEQRILGVYNAISPVGAYNTGRLMEACQRATDAEVRFTWVPADFLEAHNVAAWSDMPAWIAPRANYAGFGRIKAEKASAAGLTHRKLHETARDTLDWWNAQSAERRRKLRAGLSAERETEVLAAWHSSQP